MIYVAQLKVTRNSAVADKPRDSLVQIQLAWLTSEIHAPPYMCYHAEFGHFA